MCEDMHALLNAYLDGELNSRGLREVENHLESCAACRNDVKELRSISDLLRAALHPEFLAADRFVSQLTLRLPRRPLHDRPPKLASWAWWLAPVGLLGAWFFLRTVFMLTTAISAVDMTGLLGQAGNWIIGSQPQALWYMAVNGLLAGQAGPIQQSTLSLFNQVNVLGENLFNGFLWQVGVVLLYWGWLAVWLRVRSAPRSLWSSK